LTWTTINSQDLLCFLGSVDCNVDYKTKLVKEWHPMVLQIHANSEDNPSWDQAMSGPDQSGYWQAMEKDLSTLEHDKHSWEVVDKQDWMNVLPSTWAFKCKWCPDGSVRKLNARFCVRGDKQQVGSQFLQYACTGCIMSYSSSYAGAVSHSCLSNQAGGLYG
jgi:hypothetical protein